MLYTEWDWTRPSAIVLGGEGSGLHRLVREHCDTLVRIPALGKIESLEKETGSILNTIQNSEAKEVGEIILEDLETRWSLPNDALVFASFFDLRFKSLSNLI